MTVLAAARFLWAIAVAASVAYPGARSGRVLPIYVGGGDALANASGLRAFESAVSAFGLQAPQVAEVAPGTAPFDDRGAAERARQAGAAFALVATPTEVPVPGDAPALALLKLALVRSDDGSRFDVALVRANDGDGVRHAVSGMLAEAAPLALAPSPETPPPSVERPKTGWGQIAAALAVVAASSLVVVTIMRNSFRAQGTEEGLMPALDSRRFGR